MIWIFVVELFNICGNGEKKKMRAALFSQSLILVLCSSFSLLAARPRRKEREKGSWVRFASSYAPHFPCDKVVGTEERKKESFGENSIAVTAWENMAPSKQVSCRERFGNSRGMFLGGLQTDAFGS